MKTKITEAELCTGFIAVAKEHGWTAYPEFAGFDFLLVRNGIQVGFQAKLRFTIKLIDQIVPDRCYWRDENDPAPQFRAVLIPEPNRDCLKLCRWLGIAFFAGPFDSPYFEGVQYLRESGGFGSTVDVPEWSAKPLELPQYVPDVTAGASGPVQLTEWKIAALKVCACIELRGHATRADFHRYGVDHRRWVPSKWVRLESDTASPNFGFYVAEKLPFPAQHPVVYEQIKAEVRKYLGTPEPERKRRRK